MTYVVPPPTPKIPSLTAKVTTPPAPPLPTTPPPPPPLPKVEEFPEPDFKGSDSIITRPVPFMETSDVSIPDIVMTADTSRDRFLMSRTDLALLYGISKDQIERFLTNVIHVRQDGLRFMYDLAHVTRIIDARDTFKGRTEADVVNMSHKDQKVYYQAKIAKEEYQKKRMENEKLSGSLIPVDEVRVSTVTAFKIMGNFLDSLPDVLERDGIIGNNKVDRAIKSIDRVREELSITMSTYAKELKGM